MTSVRLQLLRRQLLSSALTPSLQYEATAFRLHALTETMRLLSPMIVGLKCSLHLSSPPSLYSIDSLTRRHYRRTKAALSRDPHVICAFFSIIRAKAPVDKSGFFC